MNSENMQNIRVGFIGLGVMGYHMALNLSRKSGALVIGYDISEERLMKFEAAGGTVASGIDEIYSTCDVIFQMLPTHETISSSILRAVKLGKPDNIIVDLSSADPSIIQKLNTQVRKAGMHLLDSPVSGGNPMAQAGTLSIMTGGEEEVFNEIKPLLECMGTPVYTGPSGSGDTIKLINNMIGGAMLAVMAEGYALAERAGIDLNLLFEATRGGFAGSPLYDNKIPKIILRDFEPGARIAVHHKDIVNALAFADRIGMQLPVTEKVYSIMHWMVENGYADEDQAGMIRYYEQQDAGTTEN
ncbi:MAG: NAD-binding protein [Mogibacterium sp.]|nr:NAD-binding protein [Mogibacterium sp.]